MSAALFVKVRVPTRGAVILAIQLAGSQRALAERFGLTQQSVAKWFTHGIPKKYWKPLLDFCEGKT
jgi:hypothetical protein